MAAFSIPMTPINSATVTAGTVSANIDLGTTVHQQYRLQNNGSNVIYYGLGADNTAAATVATGTMAPNCHPVLPGAIEVFTRGPTQQFLAYITSTGTSPLFITSGHGA